MCSFLQEESEDSPVQFSFSHLRCEASSEQNRNPFLGKFGVSRVFAMLPICGRVDLFVLGTYHSTKTDEFSEKFPNGLCNKSAFVHYGGTEKILLYHFHAEKALFKGPNFEI